MPIGPADLPESVVEPWISGLLPDDPAVIARWARQFRTRRSPFGLLGAAVGRDCAGAVQFAPPEAVGTLLTRRGTIDWLTEAEVAERMRALRADATDWLGSGRFPGRFSLAGTQAKTAMISDGDRWGVPSGVTPTSHILKPTIAGLDDHDLNEHLCLEAARRAGLVVVRSRIVTFADERAIAVERYDRHRDGSGLRRIHQEDLCQALSVPPALKYEADGGPGVARILELIAAVMPSDVAERASGQFLDGIIWNWLVAGTDAHAKNYSLLLSGSDVRLAPLYDIASALPYPGVNERRLRFAMRIGRDYRVHPHRDPWPSAATTWGLDREGLRDRVTHLAERAPHAFSEAAGQPEVASLGSDLPDRLTDLVAARAERCMRVMA